MSDIDFDQVLRSKYLTFQVATFTGKTYVVDVHSRNHGFLLGRIRWFGAWRQYVLEPSPSTVWNAGCMDDIKTVLAHLMHLRHDVAGRTGE